MRVGWLVVVCTDQRPGSEDSDVALERTAEDCGRVGSRDASQSQQEEGFSIYCLSFD